MEYRNIVQFLLFLLLLINISSGSYVALPNINFDPLQQLGITGQAGGLSIYKDTRQLTQIPAYTSSVISFDNNTFQLIGSTSTNQTIYSVCVIGNKTYIGGNFTTLNGVTVNNIAMASTNDSTTTIKPLQMGLDGPVYTMYCDADTNTLYVGGSFLAPVATNNVERTESLAKFGGNMALFKNNQWQGLPWKGVNGAVKSIVKNNATLLFGGSFDTTTDLQTARAPASQPISLISAVTAVNSSTTYSDPSTVLCASNQSSTPWTLADGETGTWQATFDYFITPTLIRLANTDLDSYKTKGFAIRPLTASTTANPYFNLSFVDPVTGQRNTCSNNCSLANTNASQDFIVMDTDVSAGGIAIDILTYYGNGGGLSLVEMYQSEIFVYAVDTATTQSCTAKVDQVSTTGTWTRVNGSSSYEAYLSTTVTSADTNSSLTFSPSLTESGFYEVLLYTPSCSDCLDVDITIKNGAGTTNVVTIGQDASVTSQSIFTGYFDISSQQPSVMISVAHNATVSSSKNTIMVNSIQFIQQATSDNLTSILQYDTSVTNITTVPWGPLSGDNLPYNSKDVYTMTILNNIVYIGGKFTSTDSSGSNYTNIVSYDTTSNQMKALGESGPNGPVYSLSASNTGALFVGGNFSSLTTVTNQMSNVARYDINQQAWNSLNGGVDGAVYGVFQTDETTVLISGEFTHLSIGNATRGNGWWDTTANQWRTDTPYISGIVYDYSTNLYAGPIASAQQYQTNGFVTMNDTSIAYSDFYPSNSDASVSSGILYNVGQTSTMVLAGNFSLPNQIQNLAVYSNQTWFSFDSVTIQGHIQSMIIYESLLYVGGRFDDNSQNIHNLAIFDLNNKSLNANPDVQTDTDSPASVNMIRHFASQNSIVIGGNFTQVGTLSCASICSLNLKTLQWNALGTGLSGQIFDLNEIDGKLVATGELTLNNNPLQIAEYDFSKNTWGPFSTADLPGPSQYMIYDTAKKSLYITGQGNDSDYLRIWDGSQFNSPNTDLGAGSSINQLSLLPLSENENNILLASGFLNLGDKNVSAAFYDGEDWIPYLVSSSGYDSDTTLSGLFYLSQPQIVTVINRYLPTGIVILVSIAISLGIVFFIVFCAMGCLFFKRKRDAKVNPESNPSAYYGKPPRDPQQLLMTLQKADPGLNDDKNNDGYYNSEEKRRNTLEPSDQLYNMSKSISTDHLHDPDASQSSFNMGLGTAGIGSGVAATVLGVGASKSHEMKAPSTMQNFRTMPDGTQVYTPINDYYTSSPVINYHNNAPMSDYSNNAPVNTYGKNSPPLAITTGMGVAATLGANAFGMARPESFTRPVSEINRDSISSSPIKTREMTELYNNENRNSYNPYRSSNGIGMAIGTGIGAVTAAAVMYDNNNENKKDEYSFLSSPPTAQQVGYGNISSSQATSTTQNDPDTVRWTQAPPEVTSVAVVKPVSMLNVDDHNKAENVRWTTANSDDAKAQAVIAPVISFDQQYHNEHQQDDGTLRDMSANNNNNGSSLSVTQPENIRWTNFSTSNAMDTLTIDPGRESTYSDFYSPPNVDHNNLSVPPQPQLSQSSSSLVVDPETVRWTTNSPSNNLAVVQIENLDRDSYHPNKLYDESESSVNAKVIHPNAFRLSDAGSLAQNGNFKKDNRVSHYDIGSVSEDEEGDENEKEVRWKVANMASPIETGEPPKLMEPASVAITSRDQTPDEVSAPFDSYFSNLMSLNREEDTQKSDNDDNKNGSPFLSENYSEKSKSIDDLIASRDLAGLSLILNEAGQHPQPQHPEPNKSPELVVPQSSTSTPMDGRAASKRMVQEYLNNKKTDQRDKKSKYKSGFKQLMTTAIENNTKTQYASEDQPHLYYAKFDFSQSEQDELGLEKGDAIIVIDSRDDIWWTGYKTNGGDGFIQGVFPSNYVEMATSLNI
ncbi:hypothetical protein K501DRAFT_31212 [Backusella circina FSU 941]|nr:hypothetical protein K501DRAFT_31212 [Backusella circina FSU 941]